MNRRANRVPSHLRPGVMLHRPLPFIFEPLQQFQCPFLSQRAAQQGHFKQDWNNFSLCHFLPLIYTANSWHFGFSSHAIVSINPSGTHGFSSNAFFPVWVTIKFPRTARAFSDTSLDEHSLNRTPTTPFLTKIPEFSRTEDKMYNVSKHKPLVSLLAVVSRMLTTNGMILDEFITGNWLLANDDTLRTSCKNSCLINSSVTSIFSGNFDKIPASTIRALFLKMGTKKNQCH
nr:hypothetical protein PanWU01x14_290160 [Ipomoea batatas]